ncbi:hypothetical protein H6B51_10470 [Pseudoflavonifractor phocaeensis]|nr:chemotaxis protein CheB [Pseudoflavonifractor phocaeensis]MBM6926338.1 hypothetical protein [Pseudoflavonifractor phocaeensis]
MTMINDTQLDQGKDCSPLIIGIGASAGGVEALQQFFSCMPPNSGLSFVVVQHLSADYKSLMADILGKHGHDRAPGYQPYEGGAGYGLPDPAGKIHDHPPGQAYPVRQ